MPGTMHRPLELANGELQQFDCVSCVRLSVAFNQEGSVAHETWSEICEYQDLELRCAPRVT